MKVKKKEFLKARYEFMKQLSEKFTDYEKATGSLEEDTVYELLKEWCKEIKEKSNRSQNQQTSSSESPHHEDL